MGQRPCVASPSTFRGLFPLPFDRLIRLFRVWVVHGGNVRWWALVLMLVEVCAAEWGEVLEKAALLMMQGGGNPALALPARSRNLPSRCRCCLQRQSRAAIGRQSRSQHLRPGRTQPQVYAKEKILRLSVSGQKATRSERVI